MIEINKGALEQTKQACHEELNQITSKYNHSFIQVYYQYLKKEIHQLIIFSLLAMGLIFIFSIRSVSDSIVIFIIYYAILGCYAVYEYIKSDYYQVREVLSIGYLNDGRRFLYTSCLFTLFEILNFITVCLLLPMENYEFIMTVLYSLVPILISQIISMYFIQYVHNIFGSVVAYLLSYGIVCYFFIISEHNRILSIGNIYILVIGLIIFYILTIIFIVKQRKERTDIWNWY